VLDRTFASAGVIPLSGAGVFAIGGLSAVVGWADMCRWDVLVGAVI